MKNICDRIRLQNQTIISIAFEIRENKAKTELYQCDKHLIEISVTIRTHLTHCS